MSKVKVRPASWFIDLHLVAVSTPRARGEGALRGPFYNDTHPIHGGSSVITRAPAKGPPSSYYPMGVRVN